MKLQLFLERMRIKLTQLDNFKRGFIVLEKYYASRNRQEKNGLVLWNLNIKSLKNINRDQKNEVSFTYVWWLDSISKTNVLCLPSHLSSLLPIWPGQQL